MGEDSRGQQPTEVASTLSDLERAVEAMKTTIEESRQKIQALEKLVEQSKGMTAGKRKTNS